MQHYAANVFTILFLHRGIAIIMSILMHLICFYIRSKLIKLHSSFWEENL